MTKQGHSQLNHQVLISTYWNVNESAPSLAGIAEMF